MDDCSASKCFASDVVLPARATLILIFLLCVAPVAFGQTFTVLHAFDGRDGYSPFGAVMLDSAGDLYGSTPESIPGNGKAFALKRNGGSWQMNTLLTFTGANGSYADSGLVFGPNGGLFGTTFEGGSGTCQNGCGIVYFLRPPQGPCKTVQCSWDETIIYQFAGGSDGAGAASSVIFDDDGNLYGTTTDGGSGGYGTVYELSPTSGGWTEKILYSFGGGNDGANPVAGVVRDAAGNLYGTTQAGGGFGGAHCNNDGCGTVYELSPAGSGWTETILHRFTNGNDGWYAEAGLTPGPSGVFYGVTAGGGIGGAGVVYELAPSGNGWSYSILYSIFGQAGPFSNMALDSTGALYGATYATGEYSCGAVFKLTPQAGGGWSYSVLHTFTNQADGSFPVGGVALDASGNIYGTASQGGTYGCSFEVNCGTVWEVSP